MENTGLRERKKERAARISGEATAVALMEANARAARGDQAFAGSLAFVLDFIRGGVDAAVKKSS